MINTKWNPWIFGGAIGFLLAAGGFTINANPILVIFLIVVINLLHILVPAPRSGNDNDSW